MVGKARKMEKTFPVKDGKSVLKHLNVHFVGSYCLVIECLTFITVVNW